jgi:hypothetical protein
MARVPVIESPCPIAGKPLPAGATEHCSTCDRSVHNLNLMNEGERVAFMKSCSGKVCVAYTVRIPVNGLRKRVLMAAALTAAALTVLPAAAQDSFVLGQSPVTDPNALPACDEIEEIVMTGGVAKGDDAQWTDDGKDAPAELPTIEDDGR